MGHENVFTAFFGCKILRWASRLGGISTKPLLLRRTAPGTVVLFKAASGLLAAVPCGRSAAALD